MKKAIIVFGSTMGTTRKMTDVVKNEMNASVFFEVEVKNAAEADPAGLSAYDVIVFGCSTWGDGVLQDDFEVFAERLKTVDLTGKKAAVFGPGESSYSNFCKAVDILEDVLKSSGAEIVHKGLRADILEGDQDEKAVCWTKDFIGKIS
jgi:flavodoxin I